MVLAGVFAMVPSLATAALLAAGIITTGLGIPAEERRLAARFGEAYQRYRQAVPALIPLRLTKRRRETS